MLDQQLSFKIPRWTGGQDATLNDTVVSALQAAMAAGSPNTADYAVGYWLLREK